MVLTIACLSIGLKENVFQRGKNCGNKLNFQKQIRVKTYPSPDNGTPIKLVTFIVSPQWSVKKNVYLINVTDIRTLGCHIYSGMLSLTNRASPKNQPLVPLIVVLKVIFWRGQYVMLNDYWLWSRGATNASRY